MSTNINFDKGGFFMQILSFVNIKQKVIRYAKIKGFRVWYYNDKLKGNFTMLFLFKCAKQLEIDVRNFLISDQSIYAFKNNFDSFDDFAIFIGKRLKQIKKEKGFTNKYVAEQINKSPNLICNIDSGCTMALTTLNAYLNVLGLTLDEFFMVDACGVLVKDIYNDDIISIDTIEKRKQEIESIQGRKERFQSWVNHSKYPTLHGFLRLCRDLQVTPEEFFTFDTKEFNSHITLADVDKYAEIIKQRLKDGGFVINRYIELDAVFLFCKERNIEINDFFRIYDDNGNIHQVRALTHLMPTDVRYA